MSLSRFVWSLICLLCLAAPGWAQGRVIVLGFDGADARLTRQMMDAGELPHMAKLAEQGTFAPLRSTNPAESAAGWAALNTGVGPVQNGVASFIVRSLEDDRVRPATGHVRIEDVPYENLNHSSFFKRHVAGTERWTLILGGAVIALLLLWLLFRVLFGMGKLASFMVSMVLACTFGAGLHRAKTYMNIEIVDVFHNEVVADGFWDYAARAGVPSIVLDAALSFGREPTDGARVLGGLGLPDVAGAVSGNWSIFTDDALLGSPQPEGENAGSTQSGSLYVLSDFNGILQGDIFGPVHAGQRSSVLTELEDLLQELEGAGTMGYKEKGALDERLRQVEREASAFGLSDKGVSGGAVSNTARTSLPIVIERGEGQITLTLGSDKPQVIREGEWSSWFHLDFQINPMVSAKAITRARLNSAADPLELYVHTFEIDPEAPLEWQPVSQPVGFAKEAADWIDAPYETLGWSCMTNQLKDRRLDAKVFLEDIEFTMDWRRRLTAAAMDQDDWRLLYSVYSTTDRVQHMMYRHFDALHPSHDKDVAATEVPFFGEPTSFADAIPAIYKQMDARVGEAMESMQPDDVLYLCADHGFTSFRRQVYLNNLLHAAGYLVLKEGVRASDGGSSLGYVDWSKTRAYSLGLGMVYLNLKGREPEGIVDPAGARALLQEIQKDLLAASDAGPEAAAWENPASPVADTEILWDTYPGDWQGTEYPCADLMVGFAEFYRIAWGGVMGGMALKDSEQGVIAGSAYKDNMNSWSGDHASNSPALVTGIFFSSEKLNLPEQGVSVMHLAPTILNSLGVPIPDSLPLAPLTKE
ncbi:MAG: putative AlkP superfamily phosphohydrolase/phosphomutase [Glaciecola sp.]|jgi:predicted AlkP superfamily phosphohydrolase/phosphomutase